MADSLTTLICTHNWADLLERALASINVAKRPASPVRFLVAANACIDDTVERMRKYLALPRAERGLIPLRVIEVHAPGKSHALNRALSEIETELTAFINDLIWAVQNGVYPFKHTGNGWDIRIEGEHINKWLAVLRKHGRALW